MISKASPAIRAVRKASPVFDRSCPFSFEITLKGSSSRFVFLAFAVTETKPQHNPNMIVTLVRQITLRFDFMECASSPAVLLSMKDIIYHMSWAHVMGQLKSYEVENRLNLFPMFESANVKENTRCHFQLDIIRLLEYRVLKMWVPIL
jgi:hypothetical protein